MANLFFAVGTAGNGLVSGYQGVTLFLCAADSALSMGVQGTAHPIPATGAHWHWQQDPNCFETLILSQQSLPCALGSVWLPVIYVCVCVINVSSREVSNIH